MELSIHSVKNEQIRLSEELHEVELQLGKKMTKVSISYLSH